MKKLLLLTITALLTVNVWAQTPWQTGSDGKIYYNGGNVGIGTANPNAKLHVIGSFLLDDPNNASDWNDIWQCGFFQGINVTNAPETGQWFWGINMGHSSNNSGYKYGGQILIKNSYTTPTMYFRSINGDGEGTWAKVLNSIGDQKIEGSLIVDENIELLNYAYQAFNIGNTEGYIWGNHDYNGESGYFYDDLVISSNWQGVDSDTDNIKNGSSFLRNCAISIGRHGIRFFTSVNSTSAPTEKLIIKDNGNVGIGTTNPLYKLSVKGTIGCGEVKVENVSGWADFVFEPDYNLMNLVELETFIQQNKHLPEIPTETEVKQNGISVGEMNAKLLQKVEELTLYTIEQQKQIEAQNQLNNELLKRIEKLENK